jgi:hypothetical protein
MRAMHRWEYCVVDVTTYREGSGGAPREFLEIRLPGAHRASVTHAFGSAGLLNQLGSEGWELVDVESGSFYLKRQVEKASAQA